MSNAEQKSIVCFIPSLNYVLNVGSSVSSHPVHVQSNQDLPRLNFVSRRFMLILPGTKKEFISLRVQKPRARLNQSVCMITVVKKKPNLLLIIPTYLSNS